MGLKRLRQLKRYVGGKDIYNNGSNGETKNTKWFHKKTSIR